MTKPKREIIGSVLKGKDAGSTDYIKIRKEITLKEGQTLSLESPQQQLKNVDKAVASGKMSEELAVKIRERVNKIPNFVRFEIVLLSKETV